MGQSSSTEDLVDFPDQIQDDLVKHAKTISEIATLSYDDFVTQLGDLNKLAKNFPDKEGKQLVFAVKKGTDSTILWKATVRIGCVKIDPKTSKVETYRLISLPEFLQVFKSLSSLMSCVDADERKRKKSDGAGSSSSTPATGEEQRLLTASLLLQHVDQINISKAFDKNAECCICLERSPEVILPCAHSYCLPCIEQWNFSHKTCPICREKLETTDDTWVISEAPDVDEVREEIVTALDDLSKMSPIHKPHI